MLGKYPIRQNLTATVQTGVTVIYMMDPNSFNRVICNLKCNLQWVSQQIRKIAIKKDNSMTAN